MLVAWQVDLLILRWQPGGHSIRALDPWLCVPPFRKVCLSHLSVNLSIFCITCIVCSFSDIGPSYIHGFPSAACPMTAK